MTIRQISRNSKCDVIHKTGSTSPIATPPEEKQATAMINVRKMVKIDEFSAHFRSLLHTFKMQLLVSTYVSLDYCP